MLDENLPPLDPMEGNNLNSLPPMLPQGDRSPSGFTTDSGIPVRRRLYSVDPNFQDRMSSGWLTNLPSSEPREGDVPSAMTRRYLFSGRTPPVTSSYLDSPWMDHRDYNDSNYTRIKAEPTDSYHDITDRTFYTNRNVMPIRPSSTTVASEIHMDGIHNSDRNQPIINGTYPFIKVKQEKAQLDYTPYPLATIPLPSPIVIDLTGEDSDEYPSPRSYCENGIKETGTQRTELSSGLSLISSAYDCPDSPPDAQPEHKRKKFRGCRKMAVRLEPLPLHQHLCVKCRRYFPDIYKLYGHINITKDCFREYFSRRMSNRNPNAGSYVGDGDDSGVENEDDEIDEEEMEVIGDAPDMVVENENYIDDNNNVLVDKDMVHPCNEEVDGNAGVVVDCGNIAVDTKVDVAEERDGDEDDAEDSTDDDAKEITDFLNVDLDTDDEEECDGDEDDSEDSTDEEESKTHSIEVERSSQEYPPVPAPFMTKTIGGHGGVPPCTMTMRPATACKGPDPYAYIICRDCRVRVCRKDMPLHVLDKHTHRCDEGRCQRKFTSKERLQEHIRRMHRSSCWLCNKHFRYRSSIYKHNKSKLHNRMVGLKTRFVQDPAFRGWIENPARSDKVQEPSDSAVTVPNPKPITQARNTGYGTPVFPERERIPEKQTSNDEVRVTVGHESTSTSPETQGQTSSTRMTLMDAPDSVASTEQSVPASEDSGVQSENLFSPDLFGMLDLYLGLGDDNF